MHLGEKMNWQGIRDLVLSGCPITFFEGSTKDMEELKRFVTTQTDFQARVNPPTKSKLVFAGDFNPAQVVTPPAPAEDKLALVGVLVGKGISFTVAQAAVEATPETIKSIEGYADVAKALGLKGNAAAQKVYEAIRDNSEG